MELKGKSIELLDLANEYARIMGKPNHAASRFTHLTPSERGIILAVQEYVEAKFAELRAEISNFRHTVTTRGDAE